MRGRILLPFRLGKLLTYATLFHNYGPWFWLFYSYLYLLAEIYKERERERPEAVMDLHFGHYRFLMFNACCCHCFVVSVCPWALLFLASLFTLSLFSWAHIMIWFGVPGTYTLTHTLLCHSYLDGLLGYMYMLCLCLSVLDTTLVGDRVAFVPDKWGKMMTMMSRWLDSRAGARFWVSNL